VSEGREFERLLILTRIEELLKAVRKSHRNKKTYFPAVKAVERFRTGTIRNKKLGRPRDHKSE
jgi:hypothetical protein